MRLAAQQYIGGFDEPLEEAVNATNFEEHQRLATEEYRERCVFSEQLRKLEEQRQQEDGMRACTFPTPISHSPRYTVGVTQTETGVPSCVAHTRSCKHKRLQRTILKRQPLSTSIVAVHCVQITFSYKTIATTSMSNVLNCLCPTLLYPTFS
mmetsp:Transcript_7511/g.13576  ORF Transcript_7511/g.13576 Transcript_7511/m.13576 type:complete len:152 (-) Transcript_7511:165-620(-)